MALLDVYDVAKVYRRRPGPRALLGRGGIFSMFARREPPTTALEHVTFSVNAGESVGIIGANGSGKSTLLKIIAGVTAPTSGSVQVNGRVASLLELGAGFHPMLTGRENIYLNGRLLGMTRAEIDAAFNDIVAFSELEQFIHQPVETYSSGMYVRLAFSVAVHAQPDLFLVDEVLAVGDEAFQRKCRERIGQLRAHGKTILFVSHDLGAVNALCDRVILLHKGHMVARNTPQETIDYYLRLVGGEAGTRVLTGPSVEAIVNNGRVAFFHLDREVGAPAGFRMHLRSMEILHDSTAATWEVLDADPHSCKMRGKMMRLPASVLYECNVLDGRLHWRIALDCERPFPLQSAEAVLHLPDRYIQWMYGDLLGAFPDIEPGDVTPTAVVSPESGSMEAGAFPRDEAELPSLFVRLEPERPHMKFEWANNSYVGGGRLLIAGTRFPDTEQPLAEGRHDLMTLVIDPQRSSQAIRTRATAGRTIHAGPVSARFRQGSIRLAYDGRELTSFLHVYTSMLIGGLWNDSHNLQWEDVQRVGPRLEASGRSRRFPFTQHWFIQPAPKGIDFGVGLEVHEPLDVQEFHTSLVLRPVFSHWRTDHEEDDFPPFDPERDAWHHVNLDYRPGKMIEASGAKLPTVRLRSASDVAECRMTAINTSKDQHARVIQALRSPDEGMFHYEPARYIYFEGRIEIEPRES